MGLAAFGASLNSGAFLLTHSSMSQFSLCDVCVPPNAPPPPPLPSVHAPLGLPENDNFAGSSE